MEYPGCRQSAGSVRLASFVLGIVAVLTVFIFSSNLYAQELRLTILHTNDEHSHLIPIPAIDDNPEYENPAVGGFARIAGAVNMIREKKAENGEPVLLFSGGDILGGPAFGWLPLKEGLSPELSIMQKIGYDAITIGNHEFDYGPDVLARYLRDAGYPDAGSKTVILGTNMRPPQDHALSGMGIRNHYTRELDNGLKIGVFGLIGDDAISKTAEPGPVNFEDPIRSARRAVDSLMAAGVDIIISVNHSGVTEDRQLAEAVPEIDVIVGGHSHTPLYEPITVGKTVIVQAGQYLNYLGVLELSWNPGEQRVSVMNDPEETPFLMKMDQSVPEDEEIAAEVARYKEILNSWVEELTGGEISSVRQVIAASSFSITRNERQRESAIGNYITDAMKQAAEEALGKKVDIAVQANGAIRSNIIPGTMEWSEGKLSFYDLVMATGLGSGADGNPGYPVVSFYLTEDEVRRALEVSVLLSGLMGDAYFLQFSGLKKLYDPGRAVLFRIPFSGTPIPTGRAVLSAELDRENDELFRLNRGSDKLLHVVTDYYIAGFLPLVGDVVPNLAVTLRDENGEPLELDDAIVYRNGSQLKVWQAVLDYTLSHELNDEGLPVIPSRYEAPEGRLAVTYTLPLWVWPVAALFIVIAVIVLIVKRR
jgi:5'-nucleotidase / UDP-sugar diphosphatase